MSGPANVGLANNITLGWSSTTSPEAALDTSISRAAAATFQMGGSDGAAPVAQTIQAQSVVAGTTNTGGQNWTFGGSVSTGSGASGDVIIQTGGTGAAATAQNTRVNGLIVKGATQAIQMPALASSSASQTGTVCWTTGTGNLTVDTTTTCLASLEELKDIHGPIVGALDEIEKLRPFWYSWKDGTPQHAGDLREQPGLGAHQVESIDTRLAGYDHDGNLQGVRYQQLTAVLVAAIQEQQAEIDQLKETIHAQHIPVSDHTPSSDLDPGSWRWRR
jgi:hypothetical protein